ncbi:hypothetical protein [Streptomyces sp. VRA16 Mangrove soil]|uniref:hypothetical protein n=1 Tax=Streptomyces sp. VRA16 Mangrove soil TaxID=2817434 RepID=UPI001A9DE4B2|nr:hypothetical protein [Streptomyces sp. VRA16 Mangrove soil]MBO1332289.1 hypothetical protein [Streptomyces sp. VRA16 Mangrove soil]
MATSAPVPRLRRSGSVPGAARFVAGQAALWALVNTVLAIVGRHAAFGASPQWCLRGVLALVLLVPAVPRDTREGAESTVSTRLVAVQAAGAFWFGAQTVSGSALAAGLPGSSGQWMRGAAHAVAAALLVLLLHALRRPGRTPALWDAALTELRRVWAWWCRLLGPRVPEERTRVTPLPMVRSGAPARASPRRLLLVDCVVRRGPPLGVPLAAA